MTEREAETLLREQGLTPERCGEDDWRRAVREVVEQSELRAGRAAPRPAMSFAPSKMFGALPPITGELPPAREYDCKTCEDRTFILTGSHEVDGRAVRDHAIPCPACVSMNDRARLAGIPARALSARLETLVERPGNEAAIAAARTWRPPRSVVLASDEHAESFYGTGKTYIGCAMLIGQIELGRPARFVQVQEYLEAIKALFDAGDGAAQAYTDRMAAEPLVMLDDLGKEQGTPWQHAELFRFINRRYDALLPTIITTNEPYARLVENLGGALVDRLHEADWVYVGGKSWRGA